MYSSLGLFYLQSTKLNRSSLVDTVLEWMKMIHMIFLTSLYYYLPLDFFRDPDHHVRIFNVAFLIGIFYSFNKLTCQ